MKKLLTVLLVGLMAVGAAFGAAGCNTPGEDPAAQKETLVVYTEAGFAPFEYVSGGKIVGVDVEIMEKVGEKLNMNVQFENVAFSTIINAVEDGTFTKVGAAGLSVTPARQEKVNFSQEYYTATLYVVYLASEAETFESETTDDVTGVYWNSLAGKTIAVQNGTTADLFLADELDEKGCLYNTGAVKAGYQKYATALADIGLNADVIIMDELPAQKLIQGKAQYKCAPLYYQGEAGEDGEPAVDEPAVDVYAIAVNKNETALLAAINEVLTELGQEGIQTIVNKHLGL